MKKYLIFLLFWLFLLSKGFAQQPPVFSQYFINPYLYNPAYAGVEGHLAAYLTYRQQWVGFNGAPYYAHFIAHSPVGHTPLSIGGEVATDIQGPLTDNYLKVAGSYLIILNSFRHYIRVGLSLGVGTSYIDEKALNTRDPRAANLVPLYNNFYMLGSFGINYHINNFNIGVSIPNIINHDNINTQTFEKVKFHSLDNILLKANYRQILVRDILVWEPHALYRFSKSNFAANQYEITNIFHIKHLVWVGASYRQNAGFVLLAGIKFAHRYAIGYAYDFPSSELKTGGSHEIHIGIHIGSRKRDSKGFIGQSKHDSDTLSENVAVTRVKPIKTTVATVPKPPIKKISTTTSTVPKPILTVKTTTPTVPEDTTPVVITKPIAITKPNLPKIVPQETERNGNILDMDPGHYVIVGSFSSFNAAQGFENTLSNQGFLPDIGHIPAKNLYYVYMFVSQNLSDATNEMKMLQRKPNFRKAWVLSVGNSSENAVKQNEEPANANPENNLLTMEEGNYLVVGSSKTFNEAQKYADVLSNMGFLPEIGFDRQANVYHTFLFESNNKEEVMQEKQKYSKNKYFKKLIILSVQ